MARLIFDVHGKGIHQQGEGSDLSRSREDNESAKVLDNMGFGESKLQVQRKETDIRCRRENLRAKNSKDIALKQQDGPHRHRDLI